jgi:uncharacterized membrane protein
VSLPVIVYILTALAAVVVVLTRLRLKGERGAGQLNLGRGLVTVHTTAGGLALGVWLLFLVADEETVMGGSATGIVALALWWVTVVAGLLILLRWLPSHGKHASSGTQDSWSDGPGLSILAHVGMLVGVCVFTYAYLTAAV